MVVIGLGRLLGARGDGGDLAERQLVEEPQLHDQALLGRQLREARDDLLPELGGDEAPRLERAREGREVVELGRLEAIPTYYSVKTGINPGNRSIFWR